MNVDLCGGGGTKQKKKEVRAIKNKGKERDKMGDKK
jgi:hypothetical protein